MEDPYAEFRVSRDFVIDLMKALCVAGLFVLGYLIGKFLL